MQTADEVYEAVVRRLEPAEQRRLAERITRDLPGVDAAVAAGLLRRPRTDLPFDPHPPKAQLLGPADLSVFK